MNIAEKLTTIAENEQIVAEKNTELEEALYSKSEGGKSWYDAFWDNFQSFSGQETQCMFAGKGWTKEIFKPKRDIKVKNGYLFFYNNNMAEDLSQLLSNLGVKLDTSEMFNGQYLFWYSRFTRVPEIDIRATTSTGQTQEMFRTNSLVTVDKLIVKEENIYNQYMFNGATNLKNITIEGVIGNNFDIQYCPLTKESITSVINALSSSATGKTVTFKKTAKEAAFTQEEWEALISTKSNWTISLV